MTGQILRRLGRASSSSSPWPARASSPPTWTTTPAASPPTPWPEPQFGYRLLWSLIPIMVALILVQEMSARMGVVTGKGLSDLIRERFGVKVTVLRAHRRRPDQFRQRHRRIRRGRLQPGDLPRLQVHFRARERGPGLASRGQGDLSVGGEDLPLRLPFLRHLHHLRIPGQARLGGDRSRAWSGRDLDFSSGRIGDDHRPGRDDHRPLDAVLSPGLHRRERTS